MIEVAISITGGAFLFILGMLFEGYLEKKINRQIIRREKYWSTYHAKPYRSDEPADPGETDSDEYPSERYQHNDVRRDYLADSMVR